MKVLCPYCEAPAKLTFGTEIYPHRPDLAQKRFWLCSPCSAYVGCHAAGFNGSDGSKPLGRLANADLRKIKSQLHAVFDPIWKSGKKSRSQAYLWLADLMQIEFGECHIGMFDESQCIKALNILNTKEVIE